MTVLDSRKGFSSPLMGDEALKPPHGPLALVVDGEAVSQAISWAAAGALIGGIAKF